MYRYYFLDFWKSIILYYIINNGISRYNHGKKTNVTLEFHYWRVVFPTTIFRKYQILSTTLIKCSIWSDLFKRYIGTYTMI